MCMYNLVQTEGLLQDYVTRIQELECELLQMQNSRFPSIGSLRPVSSQSSDSFEDSVSGIDFGGVNSDGSIFLTSGKTCQITGHYLKGVLFIFSFSLFATLDHLIRIVCLLHEDVYNKQLCTHR